MYLQAQHAESMGVDAIACITPNYFKPQSVEDMVEYMRQVARAAPNTPFYLYDINFMTQVYRKHFRNHTQCNAHVGIPTQSSR